MDLLDLIDDLSSSISTNSAGKSSKSTKLRGVGAGGDHGPGGDGAAWVGLACGRVGPYMFVPPVTVAARYLNSLPVGVAGSGRPWSSHGHGRPVSVGHIVAAAGG